VTTGVEVATRRAVMREALRLRAALRRPGDALADCPIGTVPILWNNVDLVDLAEPIPAETVLDEIARLGYEGTQEGRGFPAGEALRDALSARRLRLAEVYASLPSTPDGPTGDALDVGRARLRTLHEGGGEMFVVALDTSPERVPTAGRADDPATPRLTADGWRRLADVLDTLAAEAAELGHPTAFHQHAGTFVETADEADRLFELTDPALVGVCLDIGHWTVGGGDPVAAARRFRRRVTHVHLKDVDGPTLDAVRDGTVPGFDACIRERLFTELGTGIVDVEGVLAALVDLDYRGWLMVEQDSGWIPPSESAAIGRRVLALELRRLGRPRTAAPTPARAG
jgi:inosose dehydratase